MAQTFIYENFNITLSLNENSVYMRVINKVTFQTYEGNVDERTLKLSFPIAETYQLIVKAFEKTDNFSINFIVHKDILEINFFMLIMNILNIDFKILLKEKIISGNEEATMLLNNIEENFNNKIIFLEEENAKLSKKCDKLMKVIDNISYAEVSICHYLYSNHKHVHNVPINSTEIIISYYSILFGSSYTLQNNNQIYFHKLNLFFNLKKLKFEWYPLADLTSLHNSSLEEFTIIHYSGNNSSLTSLNGIQNFPNLKVLHIERCTGLKDVYNTLSNIKHKIKQMTFIGCSAIDQQNLKLYCEQNKIHLQIA